MTDLAISAETASQPSPDAVDSQLTNETIQLVRRWLNEASSVKVDAAGTQLAGVLKDPSGLLTNLSDSDLTTLASPGPWKNATLILGNYADAGQHTGLRPWEARVFAAHRN